MKIKNIIILLFVVMATQRAAAQTHSEANRDMLKKQPAFRIGEMLPDFKLKVINAPQTAMHTGQFKDRLLIIDFWDTNCGACIEAMPGMDALQKHFSTRIKILPVTYQKDDFIRNFWKNNRNTKKLDLAVVVEDQLLSPYFEHATFPHEVWVYKGKVIAITTSAYVNQANIEKVLSDAAVSWPVKNDFFAFDITHHRLFNTDPRQIDTTATFLKYAAVADYRETDGASDGGEYNPPVIVRDKNNHTVRVSLLNRGILDIYINGLMGTGNFGKLVMPTDVRPQEQVLWETGQRSMYAYDKASVIPEGDWNREHAICFESVNPDTGQSDEQVYKTVIADLDRLLGLHVRFEKRMEKVWIVARTGAQEKFLNRANVPYERAVGLGEFMYQVNNPTGHPYVFNETGYKGQGVMDLQISNWGDLPALRKAIAPYGLSIKEEERSVDRLVFSEVDGSLMVDGKMIAEAKAKRAAQKGMPDPPEEAGRLFMQANKTAPGVVTLPSGLQYKVIKTGTGNKPTLNDSVQVHYSGTLVNGKIFDSTYELGRPTKFKVNELVKGFAQGLQLMPEGSLWEFYIPAELGYGSHTNSGQLPPNSTLIFKVELLKILPENK
ncbi:FKBP-type peptidyl-prolyl cis-trans isomerase [Mucilaginibacter sp. UR6-11]|uniref:FKBP-type peptidyl-prolyl cis-trans isomerase n=1 Tax=Mucilaginibacter sp. UR6-11 TaxID=1435644 RepID=UPI001E475BC8|nr:FKBP-type peptidyl-prolyl cis-trans isomerase [Mucilaginibacter sp. UR6-11]MCC8423593.1 FKBP-type peptidyl-prolyl cis-trans isomerase [Mucilaginibacter sp. UR6-11]